MADRREARIQLASRETAKEDAALFAEGLKAESERTLAESGKGMVLDYPEGAIQGMIADPRTYLAVGVPDGKEGERYRLWAHLEDGRVYVYALFGHSDDDGTFTTVERQAITDLMRWQGNTYAHFRRFDTPLMNDIEKRMPVSWGSYSEKGEWVEDKDGQLGRIMLSDAMKAIA